MKGITRNNITHRMDNLPELASNGFIWKGKVGYTGSLIKRTIPGTLLYKHYGLIYGFDKHGVLWVIENNLNGVECVTFDDFLAGNMNYKIEHETDPDQSTTIFLRAYERAHLKYDRRNNNCEHFATYAFYGTAMSLQAEISEHIANLGITIVEICTYPNSQPGKNKAFNELRKALNLPSPSVTQNKDNPSIGIRRRKASGDRVTVPVCCQQ